MSTNGDNMGSMQHKHKMFCLKGCVNMVTKYPTEC